MSFPSLSPPLQPYQQYPTSASSQEASQSSSLRGSYSPVFIVLAIILVVSIVGCVLGRIYFKDGELKEKQKSGGSKKKGKQSKGSHKFQPNDIDIEFGLEHKLKPIPSAKIDAGEGLNRWVQAPGGAWNGEVRGNIGPGQMNFKNGSGNITYHPGHMEFKHGPQSIPYHPGDVEFRHGPGPIHYYNN